MPQLWSCGAAVKRRHPSMSVIHSTRRRTLARARAADGIAPAHRTGASESRANRTGRRQTSGGSQRCSAALSGGSEPATTRAHPGPEHAGGNHACGWRAATMFTATMFTREELRDLRGAGDVRERWAARHATRRPKQSGGRRRTGPRQHARRATGGAARMAAQIEPPVLQWDSPFTFSL